MKSNDELFELIKALSMHERRYVVLHASRFKDKGKNNVVRLFNILCRQKEFDEAYIRKKYAGEKFAKRYAETKYHLHKLIMKTIGNYHSSRTIDFEIQEMLRYFDALSEKGLFTHCKKVISKARKLAEQNERFPLLLEILQRERQLMFHAEFSSDKTEKSMDLFFETYDSTIQKIKNEREYRYLSHRLQLKILQKGVSRSEKESKDLKDLMNNHLLQDEARALSGNAKLLFNSIHIVYWDNQHNYAEALKYSKRHLQLSDPSENSSLYIMTYYNVLGFYIKLKQFDELRTHLKIFHTIPQRFPVSLRSRIDIFVFYYILETEVLVQTGRFKEALHFEDKIKEGMEKYGDKLPGRQQFDLIFNLSYIHFGAGQYKTSAQWLRKILTLDSIHVKADFYNAALIFNLIIHSELQNDGLLESLIRSTYRYLMKMDHLHSFERAVITFIRKVLPGVHSNKELITAFIKFKKELEKLEQDPYEKKGLTYFDLISWLESKIKKRPFAEIVREKAATQSRH